MKVLITIVPLLTIALLPPPAVADTESPLPCPDPLSYPHVCITLLERLFVLADGGAGEVEEALVRVAYGDLVVSSSNLDVFRGTLVLVQIGPHPAPTIEIDMGSVEVRFEPEDVRTFVSYLDPPPETIVGEVWLAHLSVEVDNNPALGYHLLVPVVIPK